nr:hypothetical protein [Streptomyces europaeiscabiei]
MQLGVLLPHLNERRQRLALSSEARLLGHGGVRAVAHAAGVSQMTVRKGVFELAPGATVAVTGAAGAVGGYAVQPAKAAGLTVIADAAQRDRDLVIGLNSATAETSRSVLSTRPSTSAPETASGENAPAC